jgi:hypothetical protein
MTESALRISLVILEMCRASWLPLLELCNKYVFFGLVLDAIVIVSEYRERLVDFRRGFIHSPDKPSWFLLSLGVLGTFLIAGGVAGELFCQSKIGTIETEMRLKSNTLVNIVSEEAGSAKDSADNAAKDAIRARGEADSAKQRADEIGKQADGLAKDLADSKATELAERKKVVELENSLAPRVFGFQIGPGNKTTFDELKPFAGTQVAFEVLTDAEARRTALGLGNILSLAGWNITGAVSNPELYTGFFDGVSIWYEQPGMTSHFPALPEEKNKIDAAGRCQDAARVLEAYLLSKNWKAMARPYRRRPDTPEIIPSIKHEIPANTVMILVGFKPNPFFDPDWVKQMQEEYRHFMLEERERQKAPTRLPTSPQK